MLRRQGEDEESGKGRYRVYVQDPRAQDQWCNRYVFLILTRISHISMSNLCSGPVRD